MYLAGFLTVATRETTVIENQRTMYVACRHWFGSFDGLWHWPLMEVFTFSDESL